MDSGHMNRVTHAKYGWEGEVAQYGHQDGKIMIIWPEFGGASLHDPADLIFDLEGGNV